MRIKITRIHTWLREWSPAQRRYVRRRRVCGFRYYLGEQRVSLHAVPLVALTRWQRLWDWIGWPGVPFDLFGERKEGRSDDL